MSGFGRFKLGSVLAMAGSRSPWGGSKGKGEGEPSSEPEAGGDASPEEPSAPPPGGPRNPWQPGGNAAPPRRSANIEDIFRSRGKGPGGGSGGGGFPRMPQRRDGKSWFPVIAGSVALLWLFTTTAHQLGSTEEGVVTTFGKYSRTIGSGVSLTLPWPIQSVSVVDVTSIKRDTIPEGEGEKLMLTSDQNLVDLSYLVRWNIKNLKLYAFQLEDPDDTVKEVAEAAMRASVAEVPLNGVMGGAGRAEIEQNVRTRMQAILDAYRSGVLIQGVDIKKANPPEKVVGAFQQVTVAQQEAQRDQSNARAWAQQIIAQAQGETAEFDKVYEQYKLSPEVTRRRMYYETMERVLSNNDKVVVEANGVTPYLPLPEVRRRSQQATPATGGQ
jgi:membrane protease subunit HflK